MLQLNETLRQNPLFQYLDPHELDSLLAYSKIISFPVNGVVVRQGQLSEGMFIIIKGEALTSANILGRNLENLAFLGIGDIIGESSLLEKKPATVTVIAHTELQCILIANTYFDMLMMFFPHIRYKLNKAITEILCEHLLKLDKEIIAIIKNSAIAAKYNVINLFNSLFSPTFIKIDQTDPALLKLRKSSLFKTVTDAEFNDFLNQIDFINVAANTTIIKEQEKEVAYYLILHGAIQTNICYENKIVKIGVLAPGCFFGNIYFINKTPSIVSYTSCERVVLLKLNIEALSYLQENNLNIWYRLYDLMSRSFVLLEQSMVRLFIRLNGEIYS